MENEKHVRVRDAEMDSSTSFILHSLSLKMLVSMASDSKGPRPRIIISSMTKNLQHSEWPQSCSRSRGSPRPSPSPFPSLPCPLPYPLSSASASTAPDRSRRSPDACGSASLYLKWKKREITQLNECKLEWVNWP